MDNDDDMDTGFRNPFDRLEDLEIIATGHALCLEQVSEQVKDHSQLGVKISAHLLEMIRYIDIANSKIHELEYRINQLEKNESHK